MDVNPAALQRAAAALRGMAYEHRLHILVLLRAGETTPTVLAGALGVQQTLVAHHLRHLIDARLVCRRRRGRNLFYALPDEPTRRLVDEALRYMAD
ncbi:metalloregulator ArsR/SmtB family transcription factor [Actinoplanes bogorensis]|uniref:Metalloregulator ArsR/SmtB family transcription factor n=1 Tax=Paractinoplanes bogorensis TaxID=1610840 RepID=A0ABS5YX40_9ACTN|nr:metalloregulator ArsR/SmtB family transcription factor [Actinoplanes bogorensis]MBU2668008.1 metalloregulator ArsR/SmtB family transcription factor [Actinoplanes bogorensis]